MLDTVPSSEEVPASLRLLAAEAVEALAADSATFHAVALYDERKDSVLEALPSFRAAQTALCEHPFVHDRFGTTECKRLTQHFVYQLFPRAGRSGVPRDLRRVWRNFLAEVQKPTWDYCGVANLRNFIVEPSTTVPVRLPDGVSIRGRSFEQLRRDGFSDMVLAALTEDWSEGMGASSYVVFVERHVKKSPDNFVLGDGTLIIDAQRAITALRLASAGDIAMGPMWFTRSARFDVVADGGASRGGWRIPTPSGSLTVANADPFRKSSVRRGAAT
jgi:hypothetical protein